MAKDKKNRCPGCGRHCSPDRPRCKYGRAYFEKQQKKSEPAEKKAVAVKPGRKWEKHVERDGLVWKLVSASRRIKKQLRKKGASEQQILEKLTAQDREMLAGLLEKISGGKNNA